MSPASGAAFRADASAAIGTGHVMRCLAVANALRERGVDCRFICRPGSERLAQRIESHGHILHRLPALPIEDERINWENDAADSRSALAGIRLRWLFVDHYGLDARWESAMRAHSERIIVLDDLADRPHECDLLLDQTLGRRASDYASRMPTNARCLVGPEFALLRAEFAALRDGSLARRKNPRLRQLLISLGGGDSGNLTGRVIDALRTSRLPGDCRIVVVAGALATRRQDWCSRLSQWHSLGEVLEDVPDMAALMAGSDLAIGAAGGSAWERCCLGLPSILLIQADNQVLGARSLNAAGAAILVESGQDLPDGLAAALARMQAGDQLAALSRAAGRVTDGLGVQRLLGHLGATV